MGESVKFILALLLLSNASLSWAQESSVEDDYKAIDKAIGFDSPFKSTIPKMTLGNAHGISKGAYNEYDLIRGMTPQTRQEFSSLIHGLKVTDFLIFKIQTRNEVKAEVNILRKDFGFSNNQIHYIPMRYKGMESFQSACLMTVKALRLFREIERRKTRRLFFHCTVGEDRTGMLAALWRNIAQGHSLAKVFRGEMCRWGYGAGNPRKPKFVVDHIRKDLTSHFHKMYWLLHKYRRKDGVFVLGDNICRRDPGQSQAYQTWAIEARKSAGACR